MKNRALSVLFITVFCLIAVSFTKLQAAAGPQQQYYELRIYRISGTAQETVTDAYLKDALLPALHRNGIKSAGVFKPIESDTSFGKFIYVFIPYNTYQQYFDVAEKLSKDKVYNDAGKSFLDADPATPPFVRYESVFMKAFAGMPVFRAPKYSTPVTDRIYELRSYESATDAKAIKKISMFNEGGEIQIFEKVGSNAVFYGQVLFGSLKPRLIYMTTYSDMKSHDEHWKAFGGSDGWKKLSAMEEYKNTVSKANPYLLHPTSYSDF